MNPTRRSFVRNIIAAIAAFFSFGAIPKAKSYAPSKLKFKRPITQHYDSKFVDFGAHPNPFKIPFKGLGVTFIDEREDYHRAAVILPIDASPDEIADALDVLARDIRNRKFVYRFETLSGREANRDRYPIVGQTLASLGGSL